VDSGGVTPTHLVREKSDNTMYARYLGPYIRLPFAKYLTT
jgi:hypothetical protein